MSSRRIYKDKWFFMCVILIILLGLSFITRGSASKILIGLFSYLTILLLFYLLLLHRIRKGKKYYKTKKRILKTPTKRQCFIFWMVIILFICATGFFLFLSYSIVVLIREMLIVPNNSLLLIETNGFDSIYTTGLITFIPLGGIFVTLFKYSAYDYVCDYKKIPNILESSVMLVIIQLVLFALVGPFVLLATNDYFYLTEDNFVRSRYFQLNETTYDYGDIEKISINIDKHGKQYELYYEIIYTDGKNDLLMSFYLDKKFFPTIYKADNIFRSKGVYIEREALTDYELNALVKRYKNYEDLIYDLFDEN